MGKVHFQPGETVYMVFTIIEDLSRKTHYAWIKTFKMILLHWCCKIEFAGYRFWINVSSFFKQHLDFYNIDFSEFNRNA